MFSTTVEKFEFFDDVIISLSSEILNLGRACKVGNCLAKEINGKGFVLTNPLNRWICNPQSSHNTFVQIANVLWVLCGNVDIQWMQRFSPSGENLNSKHSTVNWSGNLKLNPIKHIYEILSKNPESQHAAISSWNLNHNCLLEESSDTPFNCQVQFIIRDGRLHMTVQTRNEEIFQQLVDSVVKWTLIQELMASWLNVKVGEYQHHVSSLFIYEHNLEHTKDIINAKFDRFNSIQQMKTPEFLNSMQQLNFLKDVETMLCDIPENQELFLKNLGIDDSQHEVETVEDLNHMGDFVEFLNLFSLPIFYDRKNLSDCLPLKGLSQSLINSLKQYRSL